MPGITGRNTTIRGIHETGKHYTNNCHTPLSKQLDKIVWPDDCVLPWEAAVTPEVEAEADSLEAQLIAECGRPVVVRNGTFKRLPRGLIHAGQQKTGR
jgi:hypothetical protein